MTATEKLPWHEVLGGLTGERLAAYDDLLRTGSGKPSNEEVARWLQYHRFAYADELDGYLRPRSIEQAQKLWDFDGACLLAALPVRTVTPPPPPPFTGLPRVHDHQPDLFLAL